MKNEEEEEEEKNEVKQTGTKQPLNIYIYISLICRGIKEGEESKKAEAERDGAKRTMAGEGKSYARITGNNKRGVSSDYTFPRGSKIGNFRSVRARLVEALEAQGRDGRQIKFPRSGTVRSKRS